MPEAIITNTPDSAGSELAGLIPKKLLLEAVKRFRGEQQLLEKFGKEGLGIYMKIDDKKTLAELHQMSGIEEGKFLELITEFERLGMVKVYTVFELDAEEEK